MFRGRSNVEAVHITEDMLELASLRNTAEFEEELRKARKTSSVRNARLRERRRGRHKRRTRRTSNRIATASDQAAAGDVQAALHTNTVIAGAEAGIEEYRDTSSDSTGLETTTSANQLEKISRRRERDIQRIARRRRYEVEERRHYIERYYTRFDGREPSQVLLDAYDASVLARPTLRISVTRDMAVDTTLQHGGYGALTYNLSL